MEDGWGVSLPLARGTHRRIRRLDAGESGVPLNTGRIFSMQDYANDPELTAIKDIPGNVDTLFAPLANRCTSIFERNQNKGTPGQNFLCWHSKGAEGQTSIASNSQTNYWIPKRGMKKKRAGSTAASTRKRKRCWKRQAICL